MQNPMVDPAAVINLGQRRFSRHTFSCKIPFAVYSREMKYRLLIDKAADKYLGKLPSSDRRRLVEAVIQMSENPDVLSLHIKKLKQSSYWRLRVGGYRVIFDRQDTLRILRVLKIGPRGDVYK